MLTSIPTLPPLFRSLLSANNRTDRGVKAEEEVVIDTRARRTSCQGVILLSELPTDWKTGLV